MRSAVVQHWILGCTVFATVLWLDLVSAEILRRAALFVLSWAAASTLLVAGAGAWVALGRSRQGRRAIHQGP
jgi:hypothetical protein